MTKYVKILKTDNHPLAYWDYQKSPSASQTQEGSYSAIHAGREVSVFAVCLIFDSCGAPLGINTNFTFLYKRALCSNT